MWRRIREESGGRKDSTTVGSGKQTAETKGSVKFGPIDAFHLADLNVLRNRITKLLLDSPDHMHVTKDLVITLVSLMNFAFTYHTHRTEGIRKPDQNGTSFLQYPLERANQPWPDRESHPHKFIYWKDVHTMHPPGQDRYR